MVITIVRKPMVGSVTKNITLHNIGGINIDKTRISSNGDNETNWEKDSTNKSARFPSNVILSNSSLVHLPLATQGHWANAKITGYGDKIGEGSVEYFGVGEKDQSGGTVSKYFFIVGK